MRLLISGASGLLGIDLCKAAAERGYEFRNLNRATIGPGIARVSKGGLDDMFAGIDHFIHGAANTDVEGCERDPSACYRDNVLLTELLASIARRYRIPMTFVSSTGVYGSHSADPYREFEEAWPETHHHKSKLLAEQLVLSADWCNLVVRVGWLFGGNLSAARNFVGRRILEARRSKNGVILSNSDQRGCPTYVVDAAKRILDLIAVGARGTVNVVGEGSASRFEYVSEIVRQARVTVSVQPARGSSFGRIAPVSNNEMAVNWRAYELGLPPMRSWQEALAEYLASTGIGRPLQ